MCAPAVKMVATVLEYFFKMVSANLKKNDDRILCAGAYTRSRESSI